MSRTLRGRRTAYDNIAAGSAISSGENTIAGETASVFEVYGGGKRTSTSNDERDITNIIPEQLSGDATSSSDAGFQGPENMTVGVDPVDENVETTNNPGMTS